MALLLSTEPSIKDELVSLAATLADTQQRLQQVAARIQRSDSEDWRARYETLEQTSSEAITNAKWLQTQITDLEQKLAQQRPEVSNLLAARDAAFTKLKHARRVIRDLLDERKDMSSPRGSLTQEDIEQALSDNLARDDASSSSGSEKTVRIGGTSPPSASRSAIASPAPSSRHTVVSPSRSVSDNGRLTDRPSTSSRAISSPMPNPPQSARSSPDKEYILHWKSPPGSYNADEGPISWQRLRALLKLDDKQVFELEQLGPSPDANMGLYITELSNKEVVAFIYGPIFLEQNGRSFIIDWGRPGSNSRMAKYIDDFIKKQRAFHTFNFPDRGDVWHYVGALRWKVVSTLPVWPMEEKDELLTQNELQSRQRFLKKLSKRTGGEVKVAEMERRLDNGEIIQMSIELSGTDEEQRRAEIFVEQVLRTGE